MHLTKWKRLLKKQKQGAHANRTIRTYFGKTVVPLSIKEKGEKVFD